MKMVRGAYMNEERKIAKENGTESPICDTYEKTAEMMHSNLKFVIDIEYNTVIKFATIVNRGLIIETVIKS